MTASSPNPDDPFADMFGKLPDPRSRGAAGGDVQGPQYRRTGAIPTVPAPADAAGAPGTPARDPQTAPQSAPAGSRRAAREAAAREEAARTDSVPIAQAVTEPPVVTWPVLISGVDPSAPEPGRTTDAAASEPRFEDLFTGAATSDTLGAVPPRPSKRRRRARGWIALGIVLVILGGAAAGGLWVWTTYEDKIRAFMGWEPPKDYEAGKAHDEALVTIKSGDNGLAVSKALAAAGVTKTPEAFYDMLVKAGENPTFFPGVYKLQKEMTSKAALDALQDPANKMEHSALIREGLTVKQILPLLADGLGIPQADFEAAVKNPATYGVKAKSLEGWLFPALYTFDPGATAKDVIATMVKRTEESLDAAGVPVADRQRILTIASIIQREARAEQDFYKVSRVIANRLKPDNSETYGLLQMDSTAQYGYGELHDGTVSTSGAALKDPNPWNTYVHPGLPAGPISNPGDTAIDAAMHPADGPWYYFVTVNLDTGETVFSTTNAEHQKAVAQWQAWCQANPNSGC